jgi:hypothetical protein
MNPIGEFLRLKGLALQRATLPRVRHLAAYGLKAIGGCEGTIVIHITNLIIAVHYLLLAAGYAQKDAKGAEVAKEKR